MRTLVLILSVSATGAMAEVPRVAVDIAPIHSIVSAVMGDLGQPSLIVPPTASPHGYSMRPSEARALDGADLVVWMGHGLAPWLEGPIDSLAGDASVIELLARPETQLLDVRDGVTFAGGDHDHDHGHAEEEAHDDHDDHDKHQGHEDHDDHEGHDDHDDHKDHDDHGDAHEEHDHDEHDEHDEDHADEGDDHEDHGHDDAHADGEVVDPHAWLDPENARTWASVIAGQLADLDPENATVYAENAASFSKKVSVLEEKIDALVAPLRGRPFVVFHDAYHYFEHRFDIEAVGAVSSSDAAAPSAARVSELRDNVAQLGAVCALTEPQFNPAILEALGDVKLGVLDPLGASLDAGPELYGELLSGMATSLSKCLR